jgi:nitrogen regulatory protein PII
MRRIDAVIRKRCMDEVKAGLRNVGVEGLTLTEVEGFGSHARSSDVYRGVQYTIEFSPALWVTVVVRDEQVEDVLSAIITGARTGPWRTRRWQYLRHAPRRGCPHPHRRTHAK